MVFNLLSMVEPSSLSLVLDLKVDLLVGEGVKVVLSYIIIKL